MRIFWEKKNEPKKKKENKKGCKKEIWEIHFTKAIFNISKSIHFGNMVISNIIK